MRKRRNIPTVPVDFFTDGDHKDKYSRILYQSILDGVEQSLKTNKDSFVMARIEDGKVIRDIEILKDSFKSNLETVLDYYEKTEEYEKCSYTLNLINKI